MASPVGSCVSPGCRVRVPSTLRACGRFRKCRDELDFVGEPSAFLRVGSGGPGVRLIAEPVGLFHPLKSSFGDIYASSVKKRSLRTVTVVASVEDDVKDSRSSETSAASLDSPKVEPQSPSTSAAKSPFQSGGEISSVVAKQSTVVDSKRPGSAEKASAFIKPALPIGSKEPGPVWQLSPKAAEQSKKGIHTVQKKDGGRKRAGRHAASVALQVDRFKLNQDIERLSRKESRLLPEALVEALDERVRAGEWQKALKVFELLRRQEWYEPQRAQYLRLLKLLAEYKQCNCALELWHAMEEDKLPPSVETCTALLNAYVKSGRLADAFEVFELMKSTTDCHPDVYTYTILIEGLLQGNELDRVVQLVDEMDKNEVEQNTVTLNILLESFGKTGNLQLMEATAKDMCSNPATYPDIFTWNTILKSYGKLGLIKKMEEWYSRMQEMKVDPDGITFNIMIQAYGKKREFMKMRNVADHMRRLYFPWNDVTFNIVVEAYGRARMISEMEESYRIMKCTGIKPSAFTFTILFSAYSKERMWEKVEKIRREWKNSDIRADVIMYNSLLEAYRRWGNVRMLEETFQELDQTLQPDRASYDILINAYRSFGMVEKYNEAVASSKSWPREPPPSRLKSSNYPDLCSSAL